MTRVPDRVFSHFGSWTTCGTVCGIDFYYEQSTNVVACFFFLFLFYSVILHGGDTLGVAKDRNLLFDDSVVCLSLDRVREVQTPNVFIVDFILVEGRGYSKQRNNVWERANFRKLS